ncbi:hypothetical protein GH714_036776 [Hevea brasiliensis]|uniref:Gamma tubulin complex component C-terminal domain-containing protein n=1 Tax=Hevea brasiliensis TaxID=3981 RepID=A0A6A6KM27_HEVBR|nr:hypothetical protein GH714_036776 [Hevea brasiliensis]
MGKSINFLRVCCDAATEAAAAAAGTTTRRGSLGYGETHALETLAVEAAKRIDKHLLDIWYTRYKFKEHCLAIKRYLLLGQGDFVQYLMDIVGPELSEPANTISSFKLAGLLESAIRSSNAQYDDRDILDRLRVKMMPHVAGDRGWDLLSTLRRCQVLWNEMNHFVTNLQFYIMSEVLEESWSNFSNEMEVATDLDDPLAAPEQYLHSIVEKSLLDRLYEGIHELQARTMLPSLPSQDKNKSRSQTTDKSSEPGSWISNGRKALTQRAGEFLQNMGQELDTIAMEYITLLEGFLAQLPVEQHVDSEFLLFRLDFTEFYSQFHTIN